MITKYNNIINRKNFIFCLTFFLITIFFFSCKTTNHRRNKEARDDEKEYVKAVNSQAKFNNILTADFETEPVTTKHVSDDAADDPAVWYNKNKPEESIIFGSNKKGSIHSYNLSGKEIQNISCGKINNIDIRKGVIIENKKVDILAGSNRTDNSIVIFKIDSLGFIPNQPDFKIDLGNFEPYGFCLYKDEKNMVHAFVNNKNGNIYQYKISTGTNNLFKSTLVRKLNLTTQVEGMVVDDLNHKLYVGEEEKGVFIFSAKENNNSKGILLNESTSENKNIRYDIEGLALLPPNYLVISSQGNFSYAIFNLKTNKYVDSFVIKKGDFDGVEETDGIEIYNQYLSSDFPKGILIVQDGFNFDNGEKSNQNFKVIDLRKIISIIE